MDDTFVIIIGSSKQKLLMTRRNIYGRVVFAVIVQFVFGQIVKNFGRYYFIGCVASRGGLSWPSTTSSHFDSLPSLFIFCHPFFKTHYVGDSLFPSVRPSFGRPRECYISKPSFPHDLSEKCQVSRK